MDQLGPRHRPIVARALWAATLGAGGGALRAPASAATPEHRRTDPAAILIDPVNDDRIRPDWSFPGQCWRGLVPCFAIHGRELLKQRIPGTAALRWRRIR